MSSPISKPLPGITCGYWTKRIPAIQAAADYDLMLLEAIHQMSALNWWRDTSLPHERANVSNAAFVVSRIGLDAERLIGCDVGSPSTPENVTHYWNRQRGDCDEHGLGTARSAVLDAVKKGRSGTRGNSISGCTTASRCAVCWRTVASRKRQAASATRAVFPGFSGYDLDTDDGRVRKPDSLFMEAVKP